MNIYILTGYNGDLLDPVLSFSYDEIYAKNESAISCSIGWSPPDVI